MTERRRPLDDDDGQESLFGGEAFAAGPPAPTAWEREHAPPGRTRRDDRSEATAHLPLDVGAESPEATAIDADAPAHETDGAAWDEAPRAETSAFEAGVVTPLEQHPPFDEGQYLTGYESGPSTADLAAYDLAVGSAPTEVPTHDAGEELAALERATLAPDGARRPRAPLAGPTLDDVMSRAWEGLVRGMPAACPLCDGEVVPTSAGVTRGTCSSCGTTIE
ncbi:hypothetical protein [Solirubrobacter soli]|uniref:hypothetical protein n=1 Tax=Solirubrobacter soli TaxID=363832 RepID=UPI0012FBA5A6|nr:hypothetical protein [Solirubrobacter soli]